MLKEACRTVCSLFRGVSSPNGGLLKNRAETLRKACKRFSPRVKTVWSHFQDFYSQKKISTHNLTWARQRADFRKIVPKSSERPAKPFAAIFTAITHQITVCWKIFVAKSRQKVQKDPKGETDYSPFQDVSSQRVLVIIHHNLTLAHQMAACSEIAPKHLERPANVSAPSGKPFAAVFKAFAYKKVSS